MKKLFRHFILLFCALGYNAFAAEYAAVIEFPPHRELSLPVSGVITTLKVAPGQRVSKGDLMLALDPAPFNAAKNHAQSRITAQQTRLTESERDFQQQQELYDRTVLAAVELENAQLRAQRDRAILENAQAQLADAEYALAYSQLNAPFDALILSVPVNVGQSINNVLQSKTLITLVQQGQYQARFYVEANELEKMNIGQAVSIAVGNKQYPGKVSSIVYPSAQPGSNGESRHMVTASFTSDEKPFPVGRKASVMFE